MRRAIRALVRKTFGKNHSMKTQASVITLLCCVGFVIAVLAYLSSLALYWMRRERPVNYAENIIVVNPPETWRKFSDRFLSDYQESVAGEKGMLIYREWDAVYDIFTFDTWMEENDAFLTIVFPEDFDEIVLEKEIDELPEILTYFPSDHPEYATTRNDFCETTLSIDYLRYVQIMSGVPFEWGDFYNTSTRPSGNWASWGKIVKERSSRMVMPLLFFIGILYVCMLSGMNAIAGEKERGTFSSLLMTPLSRGTIVLGNFIGVFLHAMIPTCVLLVPTVFFARASGLLSILLLVISLSLFIAAITILISCLNSSIVSAQTTFLPIFLIILVVCVTCMQDSTKNPINPFLPIYGHFYGIGDGMMGTVAWGSVLVCILGTLLLTGICLFVSERVLHKEQFTVAVETKSEKQLRKAAKALAKQQRDYVSVSRAKVFGYTSQRRKSLLSFLVGHALLPLALLSLFQPVAMIPALVSYMKSPESTKFISMFKDITSVSRISEVFDASVKVFSGFMQDKYFILCMGLGYWLVIAIYIGIVRLREKNPLSTLGFPRLTSSDPQGPAWKAYVRGLGLGLILISSVYLLLLLTGQVTCDGFSLETDSIGLFILYILMWIPQGATEEIMMRGYMMPRVASRFGLPFAIFFSSMCFSLMHAFNAGFSILALINLALIATFFAVFAYKSGHIYTVCAMHTVWNFCQGNLFGLEVSGNPGSASILSSSATDRASDILSGGAFGPEGGLCVTIVMAAAFGVLFLAEKRKKSKKSANV
ncbi:MAG: ABC transporter permease [Clostridiales bacterium]|nr:ABC transporter permease [Clostridiales bacterium]